MNQDVLEGNWKQLRGKIRQRWARLTEDQLNVIDGKREQLAGKIQELYGLTRDEVDRQIHEFEQQNMGQRKQKAA